MSDSKLSGVIILAISIILAIAFLGLLASVSDSNINTIIGSTADNDINFIEGDHNLSILTTYPNAECSGIEIVNSTGGEEIIGEGNYTFYSNNCSYVVQTDSGYKDTLINSSYSYESVPDGYIQNSTTRTLINLMIGLFALMILAITISWIIKTFGENN